MILFQVNTPSQLINAIVIGTTICKNEKCDLYYTPNLKVYVNRLLDQKIFANIYEIFLVKDIRDRSSKINRALVRIKNALDFSKIIHSLPSNPHDYSRVFVSGISLRNMEIFYAIRHVNKKVKLSLFEEGAFEYCELGLKRELPKVLFSYFFFHQYYMDICDSLYVYQPSLALNIWENISVKEIPSLRLQTEIIPIINKIFSYNPTKLNNSSEKYIIMEQAFDDPKMDYKQRELIDVISDVVGKEKVMVKLHPRSMRNKYGDSIEYLDTQVPFEVVALNEEIGNNVFVSITSSAITNFKVILNMEPNILALYKVFDVGGLLTRANEQFIERVKEYCTSDNFYIPEEKNELVSIIKAIEEDRKNV